MCNLHLMFAFLFYVIAIIVLTILNVKVIILFVEKM